MKRDALRKQEEEQRKQAETERRIMAEEAAVAAAPAACGVPYDSNGIRQGGGPSINVFWFLLNFR